MKLALIVADAAWFWVLDESGRFWECWYENGDEPAVRLEKNDRATVAAVANMIHSMTLAAQNDLVHA